MIKFFNISLGSPLIISAIVAGVILIILLGFFIFFAKRHSYKRKVKEIEERYEDIHDQFSADGSNYLTRIDTIQKNNSNYEPVYQNFYNRYQNILKDTDKSCHLSVESCKEFLLEKKFKDLNEVINATKLSLEAYSKEATDFINNLQGLLKKDDDFRIRITGPQKRFRTLKEKYDKNVEALTSLHSSFDLLFTGLTNMFADFNNALDHANYELADKLIPQIDNLLDASLLVMNDLPYLNTLAESVIPNKIEEVKNKYNLLVSQNYPLATYYVPQKIEEFNKILADVRTRLADLNISNVSKDLDDIINQINSLQATFVNEENAKVEFEQNKNIAYTSIYKLDEQKADLEKNLPLYCKTYVINQSYINQISEIPDKINQILAMKRRIDANINSPTPIAYSSVVENIRKLKEAIQDCDSIFKTFMNHLKNLKSSCDLAYKTIRSSFEQIKEIEARLHYANLDYLNNAFLPRVNEIYNYILQMNSLLNTAPINVVTLNSILEESNSKLKSLIDDLNIEFSNMEKAEILIVYDNVFRADLHEAAETLKIIENEFNKGEYVNAIKQASELYNQKKNITSGSNINN